MGCRIWHVVRSGVVLVDLRRDEPPRSVSGIVARVSGGIACRGQLEDLSGVRQLSRIAREYFWEFLRMNAAGVRAMFIWPRMMV